MGFLSLDRRNFLKWAGLAPGAQLIAAQVFTANGALAQEKVFRHGVSVLGDLKYPADFKHYDYVNPDAPKGGKLRLGFLGSFDTLNAFSIKGDPFVSSQGDMSVDDAYETLMVSPFDQPATNYGLIAEGVSFPDDFSSATFKLRAEAKFHDGKPITPEDVVWTFEQLKKNLPGVQAYYKNVVKVEKSGEREVTFTFDSKGNRELPLIVGELSVLPKHWWTANDASGKPRDISSNTLEPALGSGPYRIVEVKQGQYVRMERVKDYWGKDLPVNVGRHNFDEVEYFMFKDGIVAFEAFKADQYDFRRENSSKQWATGYDFPGIRDGKAVKEEVQLQNVAPIQAWVLNLRREKFQDVRLRRALDLAFDFEWTNKNLFYGLYRRCRSLFNNSELEAKGLPSPAELALLEPLKAELPAEVFSTEYVNPVNDTPQNRRKNLREASKLLDEAGWKITQVGARSVRKNAKGEELKVEFLLDSPLFERIALPYVEELKSIGVQADVVTVDAAQYERRTENHEYDIVSGIWGQSLSPGNEQRDFWGSEAADKKGSRNAAGIKNKAVDALIEKLIFASGREAQITACKALDRAVMANHFFIPMWYSDKERIAYWKRFGRPPKTPPYSIGFSSTWWSDTSQLK